MSYFNNLTPLCEMVTHVLPLVYDDTLTYMELVGKISKKLNELIENNNNLPDYISNLIQNYISSGEINKVLSEILSTYMLNVKYPPAGLTPATGDGSADDTKAIQGCIDYASEHNGMCVFFPSGDYLTSSLVLKNKTSMFGQDRYATRLVLKGGAKTAMFTGTVDLLTITGLGLDGNGDIQVNNVNLIDLAVGSAIIQNCFLTDGYNLLNAVVDSDLQVSNCIFNHAILNGSNLTGNGKAMFDNVIFNSVSKTVGNSYITNALSNSCFDNLSFVGSCPVGVINTGSMNNFSYKNVGCVKAYQDSGAYNTFADLSRDINTKLNGNYELNVKGTISESCDDSMSENVGKNKTSVIGGNYNEGVNGTKNETVTGQKIGQYKNLIESADNVNLNATKEISLVSDGLVEQATDIETRARTRVDNYNNATTVVTGTTTLKTNALNETTNGLKTERSTNKNVTVSETITETSKNKVEIVAATKNETQTNKIEVVHDSYTGDFGSQSFKTKSHSWGIDFPNRHVDLAFVGIPYNVKMEGAKGDGVSDDTESLQTSLNKHAGKCVYIPAGVYVISNTLILPNNTHIVGDGVESIIQASENFKGIVMKSSHYGVVSNVYDFTFNIYNLTIDGGYSDYVTYTKKKTDANEQHGICIKGEGFEFDHVIVRNCGGDGIRVVNNVNRSLSSYENAGTSYIINSKVMFNGYSGIVCDGCVDWVLHNCDVHSNSRSATDNGNNLSMISGNCKISDCHFYKLYGSVVPKYSIYIGSSSGNVQIINSHIEGATTPVGAYGDRCFFQNCRLYSSFGVTDLRIDADYCTFIGCEFFSQVSDVVPGNYPTWLGAVVFEKNNNQKNNALTFVGCSLQETKFTHDTIYLGYQNRIELTGNAPQIGAVDHSKAIYSVVGYMEQQGTVVESTPLGFPIAGNVGIFDISSDTNVTSTYNFINSFKSGALTLMRPTLGLLCMVLNNTSSSIIVKSPTGTNINGNAQVTIQPKSANFFMGNSLYAWKHFNVS